MLDFLKKRADDTQRIKNLYSCSHPNTILTKYTCSNGTIQFVMQCQTCKAKVGNPISHRKISWSDKKNAPDFDSDGREKQREEVSHQFKMHREKFNSAAWWAAYQQYLLSDGWSKKRRLVLKRDKNLCQSRLSGCTHWATEVHHLSYDHVGDESLEELTSVCHHCHEAITNQERREWRVM